MNKWYIPDAYYPGVSGGKTYVSHEAVCFLNESCRDAQVKMTLYFEDREKMEEMCIRDSHFRDGNSGHSPLSVVIFLLFSIIKAGKGGREHEISNVS